MLTEADIKAVVLRHLRAAGAIGAHTVIANEFAIGRTAVRADLAIMGSRFIGIEVKSERDSLRRLDRQVQVYREHFDRVIVALASKHLSSSTLSTLEGLEVWEIGPDGTISVASAPAQESASATSLMSLLTKEELHRATRLIKRCRSEAQKEAAHRRAFVRAFRDRFGATSADFWCSVKGRKITSDDLISLSRFRARRDQISHWEDERAAEWKRWEEHALAFLQQREEATAQVAA